jgi:hypothetical protein
LPGPAAPGLAKPRLAMPCRAVPCLARIEREIPREPGERQDVVVFAVEIV